MNQSDLQVVEDFNAQCQDIQDKVNKLIKYLSECLSFDVDSEEKEVEVLKCIQQGIDNFDLYIFIDFIEENQTQNLQNVIGEYYNKVNDHPKYQVIKEKLEYYLNTCETRLSYLSEIKKDNSQNYYQLVLPNEQSYPQDMQVHSEQLIQEEPIEIEYKPLKLSLSQADQSKNNLF